jgi:hypothetical protein
LSFNGLGFPIRLLGFASPPPFHKEHHDAPGHNQE